MNVFYTKGKEKLEDELNIVKILKQLRYLNINLKLQKLDISAIRLMILITLYKLIIKEI